MSEPSPEEIAAASAEPPAITLSEKRKKLRSDIEDLQKQWGSKTSYLPDISRMLPVSVEAEKGVLCSVLINPTEALATCADRNVTGRTFHIPAHRLIFETLLLMQDATEPIDVTALTIRLHSNGKLDECGGPANLSEIGGFVGTAANCDYFCAILDEKATLRQMIQIGTEYAARSYDEQGEVHTLLDEMEVKVMAIRPNRLKGMRTMNELSSAAVHALDEAYERRGSITGMSTGLAALDARTDGLHDDEMIVIAARPSMGKSALMMNIVDHMAVVNKLPCAVFSLEMSSISLVKRMLLSRARINFFKFRDGFLAERDFPAITAAASKLSTATVFIDDSTDLTIQEMRARARRLKAKEGIRAIFIDYMQLVTSGSRRGSENRQVEVSEISRGCKQMAKELGLPVVVLAQIGRGAEKENRRPRLSDLRESGAIEQDADCVWFVAREEMYAETEEDRKAVEGQATVIVAKNRNGPLGPVALSFLKEFTLFEDRATAEEPQQPELL